MANWITPNISNELCKKEKASARIGGKTLENVDAWFCTGERT